MGKRLFNRRKPFLKTKTLYLVASEGAETEPRYFDELKLRVRRDSVVRFRLVPNRSHKSSPAEVLKRLKTAAKEEGVRAGDELWLVIDRDAWPEVDLNLVCVMARREGCHVALSNPCFELWLYLHMRDNKPFFHRDHCQREAELCVPGYSVSKKSVYAVNELIKNVGQAIRRAEALDTNKSQPWPRSQGTRVYELVKKIVTALDMS